MIDWTRKITVAQRQEAEASLSRAQWEFMLAANPDFERAISGVLSHLASANRTRYAQLRAVLSARDRFTVSTVLRLTMSYASQIEAAIGRRLLPAEIKAAFDVAKAFDPEAEL